MQNHFILTLIFLTFTLTTAPACKNTRTEQPENTTAQTEPTQQPKEKEKQEPETPQEPATGPDGKFAWNYEKIGPLQLGQSMSQVEKTFGKPTETSDEEENHATGDFSIDWRYPTRGTSLQFTSEEQGKPKTLNQISIFAPSKLKTSRNIGLGSTRTETETAYANTQKPGEDNESNTENIIIGSPYGGLMFHIENNLVTSIFIGAAAE